MDLKLACGRVSKFYWWVAIRSRAWELVNFIVYGHYVVCVFCHGLTKGEIVRF